MLGLVFVVVYCMYVQYSCSLLGNVRADGKSVRNIMFGIHEHRPYQCYRSHLVLNSICNNNNNTSNAHTPNKDILYTSNNQAKLLINLTSMAVSSPFPSKLLPVTLLLLLLTALPPLLSNFAFFLARLFSFALQLALAAKSATRRASSNSVNSIGSKSKLHPLPPPPPIPPPTPFCGAELCWAATLGLELKHRGLGQARMGTGVHRTWRRQLHPRICTSQLG